MGRTIFIGDVHGHKKTLKKLINQLELTKEDTVVFLGDYINRGANSKEVIDQILKLREEGFKVKTIKGNHEDMLLRALNNKSDSLVTKEFLKSFDIKKIKELPKKYVRFFKELEPFYENKKYIAVHAGVSFDTDSPMNDTESIMWIKNWYGEIDYDWLGNRIIVHGHTPRSIENIKLQLKKLDKDQVMNLDSGAYRKGDKKMGMGYLTAFDFTNRKLYFMANAD